jgi:hypothetical protein
MTQRNSAGFSATQKTDIWSRWKAGRSLHEIGRAFGKGHSSIRCVVLQHSGIAPGSSSAIVAGSDPAKYLSGNPTSQGLAALSRWASMSAE